MEVSGSIPAGGFWDHCYEPWVEGYTLYLGAIYIYIYSPGLRAIYHSIPPKWGLYININKSAVAGGNWSKVTKSGIEPRRVVYIYIYIYI